MRVHQLSFGVLVVILLVLVSALGTGCAHPGASGVEGVYVAVPPPRPPITSRAEPLYPRPGYVWVEGHYAWLGRGWVWQPGSWILSRPGFVFVQPGYDPRMHRWHPGFWSRNPADASRYRRRYE